MEKTMKVDCKYNITKEELFSIIKEYTVLIVKSETQVTKELIDAGENLIAIGMAGIGLNHIDVEHAKSKGIEVFNVPDGSIDSVAELSIGFMISLARRLHPAIQSTKNGEWKKHEFIGNLLRGKTVGILSLGNIGKRVAELCQCFGMTVVAYDPYKDKEVADRLDISLLPLEEVLKQGDFISIHSPLTEETKGMLGKEELALMKDGGFLVNLGRGGIVDEKALYEELSSNRLGGAATDVMVNEPTKAEDKDLLALDNFIVTPHVGANTKETQEFIATNLVEQIVEHLG